MRCPECENPTVVVDSRKVSGTTRRRRECELGHRFTTLETVVVEEPREIKTVSMVEPWAERILRSLDCVAVEGCKSAGEARV